MFTTTENDLIADSMEVADWSTQRVIVPDRQPESFVATVELDGVPVTIDFVRHSMRSRDFRVLVQYDASGALTPEAPPPPRTYRGLVREMPDARAAVSLHDGRMEGMVITPDDEFGIQPLEETGVSASRDEYIVYHHRDWLNPHGYHCGAGPQYDFTASDQGRSQASGPTASGTGLSIAEVGCDADFEFFNLNGSSVANTVFDIENVLNTVETRYEVASLMIGYEITAIVVRATSADPYSSSNIDTILQDEFLPTWNSAPENGIRRDLAHHFTGKNVIGDVIGLAFTGTVCNTGIAYGVVESRFSGSFTARVALSAHEIGHNWSALHCDGDSDCRIMCSVIAACGSITSFGSRSTAAISSFKNSRSCLDDLATPRTLPFVENFASTTIDEAMWSYEDGAEISTAAAGEPSGPNALELSATGNGPYDRDEIRSNFIDLSGLSAISVSYYTEHRGVESGEELVVEYWNNNLTWVELNRITSNGTDQSQFDLHTHILPANAHHAEFRIRFRTEVNESNDRWYVDNVFIADETAPIVTSHPADQVRCDGAGVGFVVSALGTQPLSYQWQKDGEDIPGATNTLFVIPSVTVDDEGEYSCTVTNEFGEALSNTASLDVLVPAIDCDDGLFCNGVEGCSNGACRAGDPPCTDPGEPICDEDADACVECFQDEDCDDQDICNGAESCTDGICNSEGNEPAGTPCGDPSSNECTEPDTCDGLGTCQPNNMPDGTGCGDEVFCNGLEVCEGGACALGDDSCPGQQCLESTESCAPPAVVSCSPASAFLTPDGGFVTFDVFLQGAFNVRGFQVQVEPTLTLGNGDIEVPCEMPDAVMVDSGRADYVFANVAGFSAGSCGDLTAFGAATMQSVDTGPNPKYLASYLVEVSQTTLDSTFEVRLVPNDGAGGGTVVADPASAPIPVVLAEPCQISIADCIVVPFGDANRDDQVNIFDILCVLDGFQGIFENCTADSVDLISNSGACAPDGLVNIFDIFAVLDAFVGDTACPDPCVVP